MFQLSFDQLYTWKGLLIDCSSYLTFNEMNMLVSDTCRGRELTARKWKFTTRKKMIWITFVIHYHDMVKKF